MPDYAAQYKALKDAKRAAQKAKGTSAAGKGKKSEKEKVKSDIFSIVHKKSRGGARGGKKVHPWFTTY